MRWQKKSWMDGKVMFEIATIFAEVKYKKHGDDIVLLFTNNLDIIIYYLIIMID